MSVALRRCVRAMEASTAFSVSGLFYWAGLLTVAYFVSRILYHAVNGVRLWVLGDASAVGPHLGAWAGESAFAPLLSRSPAGVP